MIRAIQPNETNKLTGLGKQFWSEANLPGEFVPSVFTRNWSRIISMGAGAVFGSFENGECIGAIGIIITNDISNDDRVAEEAFWFVDKSHRSIGLRLLTHAIHYVKASDCKRMAMANLAALEMDRIGKLYERMGFHLLEQKYLKTF